MDTALPTLSTSITLPLMGKISRQSGRKKKKSPEGFYFYLLFPQTQNIAGAVCRKFSNIGPGTELWLT